jgi:hypothetical protein
LCWFDVEQGDRLLIVNQAHQQERAHRCSCYATLLLDSVAVASTDITSLPRRVPTV